MHNDPGPYASGPVRFPQIFPGKLYAEPHMMQFRIQAGGALPQTRRLQWGAIRRLHKKSPHCCEAKSLRSQ